MPFSIVLTVILAALLPGRGFKFVLSVQFFASSNQADAKLVFDNDARTIFQTSSTDTDRWVPIYLEGYVEINRIYLNVVGYENYLQDAEIRLGNNSIVSESDTSRISLNNLIWKQPTDTFLPVYDFYLESP